MTHKLVKDLGKLEIGSKSVARPKDGLTKKQRRRHHVHHVAIASNEFGAGLFAKMIEGNDNVVLSSFGIFTALSLLRCGAKNETKKELSTALRLKRNNIKHRHVGGLFAQLLNYAKQKQPNSCDVNASLLIQDGLPVTDKFQRRIQKHYHTSIIPVDFQAHPSCPTRTQMELNTTACFEGEWDSPFTCTVPEPFFASCRVLSETVPMLSKHFDQLNYCEHGGLFEAVELFYKQKQFSLIVIMPFFENNFEFLEALFSNNQSMLSFCSRKVHVKLPKIKLDSSVPNLPALLTHLGVNTAFDQHTANFTPISPGTSLLAPGHHFKLDAFQHEVRLEITETGTRPAIANSGNGVAPTDNSSPCAVEEQPPVADEIQFFVNRPFMFALRHNPSSVVLFTGKVSDPTKCY